MKLFTIASILLALTMTTGIASAQKRMAKLSPAHSVKMSNSSITKCMMKGLSADEKKTAMAHMKKMTAAEKAVMMKKANLCMHDKHKGMDKANMTDEMIMAHMMKGLSMSEQKTMKTMMSKMSEREMAVARKMGMNCCIYGMKHGK